MAADKDNSNDLMEELISKGRVEEKVKLLWMSIEVVKAIGKQTEVEEV